MLGKFGVFRRGDEDYIAGVVTSVQPNRKYDNDTGQWVETDGETYSLAVFDSGMVRFIDGVSSDDFGDNADAFASRETSSDDTKDAPTLATVPAHSDAPEIPAEHPTTGTEEATTVQPPAEATEPQPQQ